MDGKASQTLAEAKLEPKTALVMGAEGSGLRRLTEEKCDLLVKLPISEKMESLNVSNAAAIALYELNR
jgi:23S rRNA (guanosine2251-2'-O)-methyltransferase